MKSLVTFLLFSSLSLVAQANSGSDISCSTGDGEFRIHQGLFTNWGHEAISQEISMKHFRKLEKSEDGIVRSEPTFFLISLGAKQVFKEGAKIKGSCPEDTESLRSYELRKVRVIKAPGMAGAEPTFKDVQMLCVIEPLACNTPAFQALPKTP